MITVALPRNFMAQNVEDDHGVYTFPEPERNSRLRNKLMIYVFFDMLHLCKSIITLHYPVIGQNKQTENSVSSTLVAVYKSRSRKRQILAKNTRKKPLMVVHTTHGTRLSVVIELIERG